MGRHRGFGKPCVGKFVMQDSAGARTSAEGLDFAGVLLFLAAAPCRFLWFSSASPDYPADNLCFVGALPLG